MSKEKAAEPLRELDDLRIECSALKARVVEAILWREIWKDKDRGGRKFKYAEWDPRHTFSPNSVDYDPNKKAGTVWDNREWTERRLTEIWHNEECHRQDAENLEGNTDE